MSDHDYDYEPVIEELRKGTPPKAICEACPWQRPCINSPKASFQMAAQEANDAVKIVEELMESGQAQPVPGGVILGVDPDENPELAEKAQRVYHARLTADRVTRTRICPVLGLRLRSKEGRAVAEQVRESMQAWDDDDIEVTVTDTELSKILNEES